MLVSQGAGRQGLKQIGLGLHQVQPCCPLVRLQDDDLTVVDRRDVRPGSVVSMVKASTPSLSRQSPAIAKHGSPLIQKRCRVLGYLLPVNSKKPLAGMRQR